MRAMVSEKISSEALLNFLTGTFFAILGAAITLCEVGWTLSILGVEFSCYLGQIRWSHIGPLFMLLGAVLMVFSLLTHKGKPGVALATIFVISSTPFFSLYSPFHVLSIIPIAMVVLTIAFLSLFS
ncbi:MAG: hypothetical protein QW794_02910 [Thermosphaera sp.]